MFGCVIFLLYIQSFEYWWSENFKIQPHYKVLHADMVSFSMLEICECQKALSSFKLYNDIISSLFKFLYLPLIFELSIFVIFLYSVGAYSMIFVINFHLVDSIYLYLSVTFEFHLGPILELKNDDQICEEITL